MGKTKRGEPLHLCELGELGGLGELGVRLIRCADSLSLPHAKFAKYAKFFIDASSYYNFANKSGRKRETYPDKRE